MIGRDFITKYSLTSANNVQKTAVTLLGKQIITNGQDSCTKFTTSSLPCDPKPQISCTNYKDLCSIIRMLIFDTTNAIKKFAFIDIKHIYRITLCC